MAIYHIKQSCKREQNELAQLSRRRTYCGVDRRFRPWTEAQESRYRALLIRAERQRRADD